VIRQELIRKNQKIRVSEISPGFVRTEIEEAGGYVPFGEDWLAQVGYPCLKDFDVSQTVNFLLMTPYNVNITELIVKPVGEKC
jgi:NADP-dependent 3-hydroxy acid dehydrogenase YdfG